MHVATAIQAFEQALGQCVVALKTEGHETWNIDIIIVHYKVLLLQIFILR